MNIIDDFKSLRRKVERMDQKAEHDAKNPPPPPKTASQIGTRT